MVPEESCLSGHGGRSCLPRFWYMACVCLRAEDILDVR